MEIHTTYVLHDDTADVVVKDDERSFSLTFQSLSDAQIFAQEFAALLARFTIL